MNIVHILLKILVPFVAGFLYRAGGADQWKWCPLKQKWWRWLMGLPIGFLFTIGVMSWASVGIATVLCGIAYYIATAAFVYGEKSWLNFLGETGKFAACGLAFGLASIPILGWQFGIVQGIFSALMFLVIKTLDDEGYLHNPWVERARGFFGIVVSAFR